MCSKQIHGKKGIFCINENFYTADYKTLDKRTDCEMPSSSGYLISKKY